MAEPAGHPAAYLVADLERDYRPRFLAYLTNLDEEGLTAAYDLGRRAMERGLGLLDLVRAHNEVYVEVVSSARHLAEAKGFAESASAFLLEALAPFEMTQRGFMARRHRPPGSSRTVS